MRVAALSLLLLSLAACGGGGEPDGPRGLLDGIPQEGVVLGDPDAPVTLGGGVEGLDVERMMAERISEAVEVELALAAQAAERARVDGTPIFWAGPTDEPLRLLAKGAAEAAAFRSALDGLLGESAREAA